MAPQLRSPIEDDAWDKLARDFMDRMGFTEASGKSPCRWVAIHHGRSKNGHDHIHIAASMVREDGTRWEGRYRDYARTQEVCRALEETHGLTRLAGSGPALAVRGEKPAERRQAAEAGLASTAPKELAQRIRAAAVASTSEAEWIRRVRAEGVVVKPFYAQGTTDVVRGYRAALKPEAYNDKLVFYKGGSLGRDLSLPRLREGWDAPTLQAAGQAAAEWQAAFRGQPPVERTGRESRGLAPAAQDVAASRFAAFNERLAQVPVTDRAAWADAARDAAGVLSAWARLDPGNAAQLGAAADTLSRSAQLRRGPAQPGRRVKESPMGTALILLAAAPGEGKAKIVAGVFVRQVLKTAEALRDHHRATANLREAQLIQRQVVDRLERIRMTGYAAEGKDPARQQTDRATTRTALEAAGVPEPTIQAWELSSQLNSPHDERTTPAGESAGDPLPRRLPRPHERSTTRGGPGNREADNDGRG